MNDLIDPITKQKITAQNLRDDLAKIEAHIEAAPDEETEIAYLETKRKWIAKFRAAVGVSG